MIFLKYCLILLFNCITFNEAYKILGVFASSSTSHTMLGKELLKTLAEHGHEVTMISTSPLTTPMKNYRDIVVKADLKKEYLSRTGNENYFKLSQSFGLNSVFNLFKSGIEISEIIVKDENVQKLLNSNEHFDAVIVVTFVYDALYAIANHFNAPLIVYAQAGPTAFVNDMVGNPNNYAYVPEWFLGFTDRMTFKQRAINTISSLFFEVIKHLYYYPQQNELTKKLFPNAPDLYTIRTNVSLVLSNSHVSIRYPRPLVPNIIEIGGHHVKDPKPLPADLQKFMDSAPNGVIYFSLGSNLRSKDLSPVLRDTILKVFSKLPQKILWKWEDANLPGKPHNVFTQKWFPQSDILAHPNLRLFITHGGWGSTVESITRGVPVVGIPAIADQHANMRQCQQMGLGVLLDLKNITEVSFAWAINEVLNNPQYKKEMQKRAQLFLDREISPAKRAVYWTEYVIRNKGAYHLQSAATHLNLIQIILLDVVGFCVIIVVTIILILFFVSRYILRKLCKSNSKTIDQKKKQS
ncbi:UDP-glycosyltransferase UGT5-like [Chrysoperla carnea]|uniref:UDP-glycosyltransferase UGT5-like n=1 Tax=Chrysoperla carnea TaxID=189513 RepID=UPI001D098E12|nr:UDP-glycosyltransferase UGT5-like [Chrysoperla carnea]